jgi:acetyltransferase-like isoleucine patch superfamily enzyme
MTFDDLTGSWDYSSLPANVILGRDVLIERRDSFRRYRSTLSTGLRLGDGVRVYTWTEFSIEPGGYVDVGPRSLLVGAIIMCAEQVSIGSDVTISYNVTIADCDFHPLDPGLRMVDAVANAPDGDKSKRPPLVTQPVVIEDGAWIGIGAIILKGVTIGAGARVAPGSVLSSDVPPGTTVAGSPAAVTGRI